MPARIQIRARSTLAADIQKGASLTWSHFSLTRPKKLALDQQIIPEGQDAGQDGHQGVAEFISLNQSHDDY